LKTAATRDSGTHGLGRAAGVISAFTFISRILGLVRDMVVARFFGAGMAADAFFVAFRIPNFLRSLFAEGSLTIAFIPVFTEYLTQKGKPAAFELARTVLTLLSIILVVLSVVGILLAPWIVRLQAFGFGGETEKYALTVLLTRITFPYILLISLVALFMGVLNSLRRFAAPAAAPIFLNVGIIAGAYWISPRLSEPIVGVAIGVLLGGCMQVGLQILPALRAGMSLKPRWRFAHTGVKRIGLLMLPAIFGSAVYQFNQIMGTLIASFLPEGSISWLYYADRLVQFPLGVFAIAISTASLPTLSGYAANRDFERFGRTLEYGIRLVFFITLPSMVGLILLRGPLVELFFERGAFDSVSSAMTALALFYYCLGLWAFSGVRILVSAFYALQDTRTPVKIAIVALVTNLSMSLVLMGPLKHGGLALALTLASTLQFACLLFLLKRRVSLLALRPVARSILKSACAAVLMAAAILLYERWTLPMSLWGAGFWPLLTRVAAAIGVAAGVYFGAAVLLRCPELDAVRGLLRRR